MQKPSTAIFVACVPALLIIISVSGCPYVVAPRHDYPSEYPVAQSNGACPNLNGAFENAGTELKKTRAASAAGDATFLSALVLPPGLIPSETQVTSLRMSGPSQGLFEIEALSADRTVSHTSMPSAPNADGFVYGKPFSRFLCIGGEVVITNEPVTGTTKSSTYAVAVKLYRAKDGSLILARERVYQDYIYGVDLAREWFRFEEASLKHSR